MYQLKKSFYYRLLIHFNISVQLSIIRLQRVNLLLKFSTQPTKQNNNNSKRICIERLEFKPYSDHNPLGEEWEGGWYREMGTWEEGTECVEVVEEWKKTDGSKMCMSLMVWPEEMEFFAALCLLVHCRRRPQRTEQKFNGQKEFQIACPPTILRHEITLCMRPVISVKKCYYRLILCSVPQIVHTWFLTVQFLPSAQCFPSPTLGSFFLLAFSLTELFLLKIFNCITTKSQH